MKTFSQGGSTWVRIVGAWLVFVSVLSFVCGLSLAAQAEVEKITIDGPIHPITDEFIGRAIEQAREKKADALVIELSTPGGLLESTRDIIEKIVASPVPVIVYVAPSGARAASAGFFILEAADVAAMAPGTNTGASHPVTLTGGKMDDVMKAKVENDAAALMRSVVSKRGRNVPIAETAVRESKSWTDEEALQLKLIDVVANDDQNLFQQLDGRTITRFDGSKVVLHLAGEKETPLNLTLRERVLAYLMDPNVSFILLAIGLLALYVEFNHPGAIVPGVVGLIFILLAIFAFNLLPVRWAALVLILTSFALFTLEAKFATHGILTIGGIATMVIGALLLVDTPVPEFRVKLVTALAVSVPIGIITAFLFSIALKARRAKVTTGEQGLIGEIGVVRTPLTPEGKVFVHGELWSAVAPSEVAVGEQVVVRSINEGFVLMVEPVRAPSLDAHAVKS
jgi:membrane-bound serine protease (ClpP class)